MSVTNYKELIYHTGHKISVVTYSDRNVAIECEDCNQVLLDYDEVD